MNEGPLQGHPKLQAAGAHRANLVLHALGSPGLLTSIHGSAGKECLGLLPPVSIRGIAAWGLSLPCLAESKDLCSSLCKSASHGHVSIHVCRTPSEAAICKQNDIHLHVNDTLQWPAAVQSCDATMQHICCTRFHMHTAPGPMHIERPYIGSVLELWQLHSKGQAT